MGDDSTPDLGSIRHPPCTGAQLFWASWRLTGLTTCRARAYGSRCVPYSAAVGFRHQADPRDATLRLLSAALGQLNQQAFVAGPEGWATCRRRSIPGCARRACGSPEWLWTPRRAPWTGGSAVPHRSPTAAERCTDSLGQPGTPDHEVFVPAWRNPSGEYGFPLFPLVSSSRTTQRLAHATGTVAN